MHCECAKYMDKSTHICEELEKMGDIETRVRMREITGREHRQKCGRQAEEGCAYSCSHSNVIWEVL